MTGDETVDGGAVGHSPWDDFQLPKPLDKDNGPPVEIALIGGLYMNRLAPDDARKISRYIHTYKAWREAAAAWHRMEAEEFRLSRK